jgi:hypothetical protein
MYGGDLRFGTGLKRKIKLGNKTNGYDKRRINIKLLQFRF